MKNQSIVKFCLEMAFVLLIITICTVSAETNATTSAGGGVGVYNGTDLHDIIGFDNSDFVEMNASNFAGFLPGESLRIYGGDFVSYRIIHEDGLVYETRIEQVEYESAAWEGEKYPTIALFRDIYVPISEYDAGELAILLVDSGDNYTLVAGEPLDLGNGYGLSLLQIDVGDEKVWMGFSKDGSLIDDEIVDISAGPATWILDLDIAGEDDVEVLRVNVAEISQTENSILINGIWLIDFQKVLDIESSDEFGILEVDSVANSIYMVNNEPIDLFPNSIQDIADGMKFKVNDSFEYLEFYLLIESTEPRIIKTIYVNDDGTANYTTITEAMYNVNDGDTVIVYPGTYVENVFVNKEITITSGSGSPNYITVYAENADQCVFQVTADNVTISGFSLSGANDEFSWPLAGIYLNGVKDCSIVNNVLSNNMCGILLSRSENNTLLNNLASENVVGIVFEESINNTLLNNNVSNNQYSGIDMFYSNGNILSTNNISNNEYGMYLDTSWGNSIYNNYFSNMQNIEIYDSENNWNVARTEGLNIVGGSFIGGNFWAKPDGTGFSQNCTDVDGDGICDGHYEIGMNNIDYLPLILRGQIPSITNFAANITSGTAPLTVQFSDLSFHNPTSWEWDVDGNGEVDYTIENPIHIYSTPGAYTVTLTANNETGSYTKTKVDYITVEKEMICVEGPIYSGLDLSTIIASQPSDFVEMNTSNFAGFILGEKLQVYGGNFVDGRTIMEDGLRYHTSIVQSDYKANFSDEDAHTNKDTFPQIGLFTEEYVSLADDDAGELVKLLMDSNDTYKLTAGEPLELPEGYALTAKQIDIAGDKVWMEFSRNGTFLEDHVIDITAGDAIWNYDLDVGDRADVIVLRVLVTEISQADNSVTIEGLWLIDFQNVREINAADMIGILEVDSVTNSLYMVNYEPMDLITDSSRNIAEGLKFKVLDDTEKLTFCLQKCVESKNPIADFTADVTVGEAPLTVQFTAHSNDADSWEWDVDGDGEVDYTTENPLHVYDTVGTYDVTLTVSDELGGDTKTKFGYVRVINGIISMEPGWNLISFPENLDNSSIDHVLQDYSENEIDMVFFEDASSDMMLVPSEFEPLKGYWVHNNMSKAAFIDELYLKPRVPSSPPALKLYPGWNAIGHTSGIELPARYALWTVDDSYIIIKGPWVPSENEFKYVGYNGKIGFLGGNAVGTDIFNMNAYEGYYVFVENECMLA